MADFSTSFHQFVARCTEEYLIKYANKGLYNRALKDIEKGGQVEYDFLADRVTCTIDDGTVCQLTDDIERFSCSCPSDKICKHVLIAILAYNRQHGVESVARKADFSWMLTQPLEEIRRHFRDSQIDEVLFRIQYEEEMEIAEGAFLTISLKWQGVEVSFLEQADISKSMCSCKGSDNCIHKLEAIIRYRMRHQISDSEGLYQASVDVSYSTDVVSDSKNIIAEIISVGLAKLPQTICTRLEVLAIALHNGNLPKLEKEIRGINGELVLFFKRHVRFSKELFLERLTQMYMSLAALEQEAATVEQKAQLKGSFKSKYYLIPRLQLYALGANPWETRSSYKGITYYFFSLLDKQIYTYTDARPVYYEGVSFDFVDQYAKRSPWSADVTMKQIASAQLLLATCKVNRELRLSSAEETALTVLPRMRIEDVELGDYLVTNWSQGDDEAMPELFSESRERLVILKASKVREASFQQVTQNFVITVEDAQGNQLDVTISYNKEWEGSVRFLEKSKELYELRDFYILVQKYGETLYPISFLKDETLSSLKLDFSV